MSMQGSLSPDEEKRVEDSLRRAIKLNPSFAPSFDRLAVFLGSRHRDLEEARMMGLTAITLEPSNVSYRMNVANVLMEMQQGPSAVMVLEAAAKVAKTPEESGEVENALTHVRDYLETQRHAAEEEQRMDELSDSASEPSPSSAQDPPAPRLVRRDFVGAGPHRFLTGAIHNVHCDSQKMDLSVKTTSGTITLHSDNYYKVTFTTLGFQPSGDLRPCKELEGRPAKVEYQESADKGQGTRLFSIELHK